MKFMCIRNELQPTYAVRDCCRVLVVSTSEVAACMDLREFMLNFASGRFMSM